MIKKKPKYYYKNYTVNMNEFLRGIYGTRCVHPKMEKHIENATTLLIKLQKNVWIKLGDAAKIVGYDYNDSTQRYLFKHSFLQPLIDWGIVSVGYRNNEETLEIEDYNVNFVKDSFNNFGSFFEKFIKTGKTGLEYYVR